MEFGRLYLKNYWVVQDRFNYVLRFNKYMKLLFKINILLIGFFLLVNIANAALLQPEFVDDVIGEHSSKVGEGAGFDESTDFGLTISTIIETVLGFLGIVFLVLIIYAGFTWMTAGGDSDKVLKAKETIKRSIIGLVIVIMSYSLTYFIFSNL